MRTDHLKGWDKDSERIAKVFQALGNEHRQRILMMFEPEEAIGATRIVEACGISRTAAMHHIKALEEAGILEKRKSGRETFYTPNAAAIEAALEAGLRAAERLKKKGK